MPWYSQWMVGVTLLAAMAMRPCLMIKMCNAFTATSSTIRHGHNYHPNPSAKKNAHVNTNASIVMKSAKVVSNNGDVLSSLRRTDRSIEASQWREYCSSCNRPTPQCLCDHLPKQRIKLETQVLILQHPVEFRRKTISTVPLMKLVLEDFQVLVGRSFDGDDGASLQLEKLINDACNDGRVPLLLFPGPDAITLEDANAMDQLLASKSAGAPPLQSNHDTPPTHQQPQSQPPKYLLIIVDGTWTQAKRMLRNSPILLDRCQSVQFTGTNDTSIYDSIRKQPDSHCLSTLESCERTLQLLEPNNPDMPKASEYLLEALRAMILTQMKYERIHLEKNPELIRNVSKLREKKERQKDILRSSKNNVGINDRHDNTMVLPEQYSLRPLVQSDAKYVDSIWPFQSKKSLGMITKQILADNVNATKYGTSICLGIELLDNNDNEEQLVACIIRHRNGSVGILHVNEDHRRFGLGVALLREAMKALSSRKEELFAYILDGNTASEGLFAKLGWEKADPKGKRGTGSRRAKRLWVYTLNGDKQM